MTWKQLVAMGGVFYLTFISLRICCPAGDKFVIVAVSAFFTFFVVKSFVYTLEWRKETKEFKKLGVRVPEGEKRELYKKLDEDYLLDPAFADDPANAWHREWKLKHEDE